MECILNVLEPCFFLFCFDLKRSPAWEVLLAGDFTDCMRMLQPGAQLQRFAVSHQELWPGGLTACGKALSPCAGGRSPAKCT